MSHVRHRQANRNLQGWSYTLARVLGIAVFDWADRDSGPRFDALDNVCVGMESGTNASFEFGFPVLLPTSSS